jgi:hypothetical protein
LEEATLCVRNVVLNSSFPRNQYTVIRAKSTLLCGNGFSITTLLHATIALLDVCCHIYGTSFLYRNTTALWIWIP